MLLFTAFNYSAQAVESQTVACTAGNLATVAASYLTTVTNLTVTGTIDARDFKTMRDDMPLLAVIDLSGSTVEAYTGTEGTEGTTSTDYNLNGIPNCAFYNSSTDIGKVGLLSFIYPSSITVIGNKAFMVCTGITGSLTIPSTVMTIGDLAFYLCSGFTGSLNIPSSVITIGKDAFGKCSGFIGSLTIPSSVVTIHDGAFWGCSGFTGSLSIPSSVKSIGGAAFYYCYGFTGSLTIPSSVVYIGPSAFFDCSSLTSIYASPSNPININGYGSVFSGVDKTIPLHVSSGSKGLYETADQWKDFLNIVDDIVPTSIEKISTNSITIFPNPATSYIIVSELSSLVTHKTVTLSVTDVSGRTLFTQEVEPSIGKFTLDISSFKKGIYFIAIQTSNSRTVTSFVKE